MSKGKRRNKPLQRSEQGSWSDLESALARLNTGVTPSRDEDDQKRQIRDNERRKLTMVCDNIRKLIEKPRSSRRLIETLLNKAIDMLCQTDELNDQIPAKDTKDFDEQYGIQLKHLTEVEQLREDVQKYMDDRRDDPPSRSSERTSSRSSFQSFETRSEIDDCSDDDRVPAGSSSHRVPVGSSPHRVPVGSSSHQVPVSRSYDRLPVGPSSFDRVPTRYAPDPVVHTRAPSDFVVQPESTPARAPTPDDWIDDYRNGCYRYPSRVSHGQTFVKTPLPKFSGKALEWFSFIDLFRSLVHDCYVSPGEKLAVLKTLLEGPCKDIVYVSGGGEDAYKSALGRLKATYGRRDVMRAAHRQALEKLELNGGNLQKNAEKVRSHLLDLVRVGETAAEDIVNKISQSLSIPDQVDWNVERRRLKGEISLEAFSSWLSERAEAYTNPFAIAAAQIKPSQSEQKDSKGKGKSHVRGNAAAASVQTVVSKEKQATCQTPIRKVYCFHCEMEHRLVECPTFKSLPVADRFDFVKKHKLCTCCFGPRHVADQCRFKKPCGTSGCTQDHHPLLHGAVLPEAVVRSATAAAVQTDHDISEPVALGVVQLTVHDRDGRILTVNALFDEGSTTTLIREGLQRRLGIKGEKQILTVHAVGGSCTRNESTRLIFKLHTPLGEDPIELQAFTLPVVADPVPVVDWGQLKTRWPHLVDLPLSKVGGRIDILLGLDQAHLMLPSEIRAGKIDEPVAIKTRLGWIVRGVVGSVPAPSSSFRVNHAVSHPIPGLESNFKRFCEAEAFGTEFKQDRIDPDDQLAIDIVTKGTRKLEVGYEVALPWKPGEPCLRNNRKQAEYHLQSLRKRFERNAELYDDYRIAIQKYTDSGYVSRVNDADVDSPDQFYLPHHGVYKKSQENSKLRVVMNSAAKFQGKCLNDALLAGPALQNQLPTVLIGFREGAIGIAADIEAMFSRVRLRPSDARYHRFLWWDQTANRVVTFQMDRLAFGDNCSPFVAISVLHRTAHDAGNDRPEAVNAILKRFYVDDYLDSAENEEQAIRRTRDVAAILRTGDFHLQGWVSNSQTLLDALTGESSSSRSSTDYSLAPDETETKVLGICWRPASDMLTFKVSIGDEVRYTRAGLLSKVASLYDPLGFASTLIVKAKIKLRELGTRGLTWDQSIPPDLKTWWETWFATLDQLNNFAVPRCLFPDESSILEIQLHTFSDASEEAFAATVYLRLVYRDHVVIRLVMAKTKLSPKKTLSIPKLELQAALLGARLADYVQSSLTRNVAERFFWTDSSCVRSWVRSNSSDYKQFVSHRIGELQTLTQPSEWRFVPGRQNPSDEATRSELEPEQRISEEWLRGPAFLYRTPEYWPTDLPWIRAEEEIRSVKVEAHVHQMRVEPHDWNAVDITPQNLVKFKHLEDEPLLLLKKCQSEAFPNEISAAEHGEPLHRSSSLLSLSPLMGEDGLLRLGGRIGKSKLPYDNAHPIILPSKHPLTSKIIRAFHEEMHHAGTDFLLAHIRQFFWIVKGRELVKQVRRLCPTCIRDRARPAVQLMADLPDVRLDSFTPPFTRTAVDYFGPLEVAYARNRVIKRYGALFTCLVTRAVYVDLAASLSTEDFLLSLRRFIGMYGCPRSLHSDNGTNFVGAEKELLGPVRLLNESPDLQDFSRQKGIDWRFQPPSAPHFGGAHETMVRSVKCALYKALNVEKMAYRHPTDDVLRTLLFEIAGLLNSRPLTYVSSDPDDLRPLTPNDFLNRPPTAHVPLGDFREAHPREYYRYVQRMTSLFWDLWSKQYLQSLALRKKWKVAQRNFTVGDVVLMSEPNLPRGQWSVGRVVETHPGPDGLVRVARIRTETGNYLRPIHRLCLLEAVEASASVPTHPSATGECVTANLAS